jgi:hypothetical protein
MLTELEVIDEEIAELQARRQMLLEKQQAQEEEVKSLAVVLYEKILRHTDPDSDSEDRWNAYFLTIAHSMAKKMGNDLLDGGPIETISELRLFIKNNF